MRVDLTRTDPKVNMDRFYHVELTNGLFDIAGVERVWGRRGTRGRHRVDWYKSRTEAVSAMSALVTGKKARGYVEIGTTRDRTLPTHRRDLLPLESALLVSRYSGVGLGDGDRLADLCTSPTGQPTGSQGHKNLELPKNFTSGFPVAPKLLLSFA